LGGASIAASQLALSIHKFTSRRLNTLIFLRLFIKIDKVTDFALKRINTLIERRALVYENRLLVKDIQGDNAWADNSEALQVTELGRMALDAKRSAIFPTPR
jgi:hypothetical protein